MDGARDLESRVALRAGVRIAPADSRRWQVRWDFDEVTFLEGEAWDRVLPWLLPALEESASARAIEELAGHHEASRELAEVLRCLGEQGFLSIDAPEDSPERFVRMRVSVLGRSRVAEFAARSITEQGFPDVRLETSAAAFVAPDPSAATDSRALRVVIETDFLPRELAAMNAAALEALHPWMLLAAWNRRVLVGPIMVPGETACHACYRTRLDSHRRHLASSRAAEAWLDRSPRPGPPEPVRPAIAELAAAWAALEVSSYASGSSATRTVGHVLVYQPEEARLSVENVLRIPWCRACDAASLRGDSG